MCAVPNMAVCCSSLTSCFPGILLMYFLNDFEIVLVAPIILVSPLFLHSTCPVFLGPRCIGPEKGSNPYIILFYSALHYYYYCYYFGDDDGDDN